MPIQLFSAPIASFNNTLTQVIVFTELSEEQLYHVKNDTIHACHQLTGLPTRSYLEWLVASRSVDQSLALLLVDLDHFKHINHTLGYETGNFLLKMVAERLQSLIEQWVLVHLRGDQFVILLSGVSHTETCEQLSHQLIQSFREPFFYDEHTILVSPRIGITMTEQCNDSDLLIRQAEIAVRQAKCSNDNFYCFFEPHNSQSFPQYVNRRNEIVTALKSQHFVPFYQPLIDIKTHSISSCELLARWQRAERGIILPTEFMAAAEKSGLIDEIGHQVMSQGY